MSDDLSPVTRDAILLGEACRRWHLIGATQSIRHGGIEELSRQAHRLHRPGMPASPPESARQAERREWIDRLMLWSIDQAHGVRCDIAEILAAVRPVVQMLAQAETIEESGLTWLAGTVDQWHMAQRARTVVRIARLCAYRSLAQTPTEERRALLSVVERLARNLDGILAVSSANDQLSGWRSGPDLGSDLETDIRALESQPPALEGQAPPTEPSTPPAADDLFAELRERLGEFKGKQRRVLEIILDCDGSLPVADLATDREIEWQTPFDDAYASIQKALRPRLRSLGYWLERIDNRAILSRKQ